MIKIVELGQSGETMAVRAIGAAPTPGGTVQDGRIADPQAVGRALRDLLGQSGIRTRQAVASVNGQVAIVREIRLPNLPAEEIRQAARFEVERYLPYPIAEVTYDTCVTGEMKDEGNTRLEVLVVAARTDILNQHVETLRVAGLEPTVLDVELFALPRAMVDGVTPPPDQAIIYIHIGAENTAIVVASGGLPRVMRNVVFGSNTITRLLAERLGVDRDKAEALTWQATAGGAGAVAASDATQVQEVVTAGLADLTTEVRRSLDYYGGRFRGAVPERAVVTGGGAVLPGLTGYLSTDLDVPVEVGDPFEGLAGTPKPPAGPRGPLPPPAMTIAVGLARRGADEP